MSTKLDRLMNPKHIVVVGGLEAERVIEQCDKIGFKGTIYPINPKRKEMKGRKCLKNIEELVIEPDAAYIAVNRERSIEIVKQLVKKNCGGAICYAAGFAEIAHQDSKGQKLQKEIVKAAETMPLIGPNCYGLIHTPNNIALWPDQHGTQKCQRGVAIITQSSNIAINLTMQQRGMPIAVMMTAGNQAQMGLSAIALALVEKEHITAIGLHIEGLDNVKDFEQLSKRARELKKPIVALKVGKSQKAQKGTLTHTASLAGADDSYNALFQRLGIARVNELDTFVETLKVLDCGGTMKLSEDGKASLLSMSCSGGEASLMADYGENENSHGLLNYTNFNHNTKKKLEKELGGLVNIDNPLDYNTYIWGEWEKTKKMFVTALSQKFDFAMLVIDFPRSDSCDTEEWVNATNAFALAVEETGARAALVTTLKENLPEHIAWELRDKNIITLNGMTQAIKAVNAAAYIEHQWKMEEAMPLINVEEKIEGGKIVLFEDEAKSELARKGLKVPKSFVVKKDGELDSMMNDMAAPFVVKGIGIAHKSEENAVKLNVNNIDEVKKTMGEMQMDQFLVEEMIESPCAELIVGVRRDPLGLVMTIGEGGVRSELHKDITYLMLPITKDEILKALKKLRIFPLLIGYRGGEKADMNALLDAISIIADYAGEMKNELIELDVNPLFVLKDRAIAVDALIVKKGKKL